MGRRLPTLAGQQSQGDQGRGAGGHGTELLGPSHEQVQHRHHQGDDRGQSDPDAEPLHALATVTGHAHVAGAQRGDDQQTGNGPADSAIDEREGVLGCGQCDPDAE